MWYNQLPSWGNPVPLPTLPPILTYLVTSGTWTNATLIAALKTHIQNEVTHYKGQCYAWDVVNEAFNDDGTYRTDVFYNTIGPEYIPIAFETAALYDSSVKLYYNDYNIEYSGVKATAALNLVQSLKARGIKIDGVGLQSHFIVGETPSRSAQAANMNTFIAEGVEVAITELDIRFTSLPPTDAGLAQQSTDYVSTVGACLDAMPGCVGITVWDYTDEYSWIPSTFSGEGDACLWYANLTVHPAYAAVVSALGGTASAAATSSVVVTATSTSSAAATTTTASSGTIAKYGQCGGTGWTGTGTCVAGSTCTYSNAYYSQCL